MQQVRPLRPASSSGLLAALAAFALGLAGWAAAIYIGIGEYQDYADAETADGVVSRLNAGGSHPEIEFTTKAGKTISYPQGGWIGGYQPGDHVRVLYHATGPEEPTLDVVGAKYSGSWLIGEMATMPLVVGFAMLIWLRTARGPDRVRRRLRWEESGPRARMRPQAIRIVLSYCVVVALGVIALGAGTVVPYVLVAAVAWIGWALYLQFYQTTQISFEGGMLVVTNRGWRGKRLEASLDTVAGFAAHRLLDGNHVVLLDRTVGHGMQLPIRLAPLEVRTNVSSSQVFPAPVEYAEFVAERLTAMLGDARRGYPDAPPPPAAP